MSLLRHIWYIALKDLKLFATDRGALFFFILFPLLFMTMFALLGGGGQDPRLELHLVTLEPEGGLSHQIIGAIETADETELEPGSPKIIWDKDYNKAKQMVENGEIDGFLVFPADFTEGLMTGSGTQLEIVADIEAIETRAALQGLAGAISSRVGSEYIVAGATIDLLIKQGIIAPDDTDEIERIVQQIFQDRDGITAGESFIEITSEKVGEIEAENPANWSITGYLVMFVFFGAALTAESIVRERQNNTLERLLTGSVSREGILGGIFTGTAAKGLVQILIFWLAGILIFKADLGLAPAAVIILSVLMVIVSSSFGVMLATLVKTQRSAGSIGVLTSLVLAPLGGCWWPLFLMPKWLQALAKISPHGWANTAFNKLMLFSADFGDVVPEMLVLVGFAVVFGFIAVWRFRTSAA